ncbi:MAG: DUF3352 domain-containing protein [Verrucomicrobia bacterium]|nr:DUF3352 domain-containing protein [Verrucomicrobiota bacterium]
MKLNRSFACILAVSTLALGLHSTAAVPPAEKLLPADTLAVLTLHDWDKVSAAAKDFPLAQLWRDPAMKPFAEKFERKLGELIGQEDKDFAREWAEFKPLVGGQVTFAVIRNEWQGEHNTGPDVVVFLDVKDKARQLREFLDKCEKHDADAGKTIQRETVRGVKFSRALAKDAPKKDDAPKKPQPYIGQAGSLLLLSESTKALEKVLARQDGAGAGLDETPEFERARSTVGRDAHVFGWVNVKAFTGVLAKLPAGPQDGNPLGVAPARILDAVGLGSVEGLALAARLAGEGTHVEFFIQSPQAKRKGLLGILTPEPKEAGPLPFVGGDTTKFTRIRMDGQKAFAALERILTDLNPQLAGMATIMLDSVGKDKDPNFDLRKQVFGNLGADFVTIQKSPRGTALADLKSPPTLYLVGSPKPEALMQAVRTVSPLPPTEREFLGRKIFTFQLLPGLGGGAGQKGQLSLSTSGGYLAVSTDAAMLEEMLRGAADGKGKPLSEVPGLAEAAQKAGGFNTGWFAYDNQTETLRSLFEALKKDPQAIEQLLTPPLPTPGANFAALKSLQGLADFSLLPEFGAVAKYFGFSVQTTSGTPEGISFKSFMPVPAGLKK